MTGTWVKVPVDPQEDPSPAPTRDWVSWLSDLEAAATELEHQLEAGEEIDFPAPVHAPRHAAGTPSAVPAEVLLRAEQVLRRLTELTAVVQERQDAVRAQLAALPSSRPRRASGYSYDLGNSLDING